MDFDSYRSDYQLAAASATTVLAGAGKGAKADIVEEIVIIPLTVAPGIVQLVDGDDTAITIFAGSAAYEASLKPVYLKLGARSRRGAWSVICGANVQVLACGRFQ